MVTLPAGTDMMHAANFTVNDKNNFEPIRAAGEIWMITLNSKSFLIYANSQTGFCLSVCVPADCTADINLTCAQTWTHTHTCTY